jgi:hypothetical protein
MKALLSILLGLMLVTSLVVGTAYAYPAIQPLQNTSNNPCGTQTPSPTCTNGHSGGGGNGDPHGCGANKNGLDGACAGCDGITPNDLATSDLNPDFANC